MNILLDGIQFNIRSDEQMFKVKYYMDNYHKFLSDVTTLLETNLPGTMLTLPNETNIITPLPNQSVLIHLGNKLQDSLRYCGGNWHIDL